MRPGYLFIALLCCMLLVLPAAAADGKIVFFSNRNGAGFEIYAMNADGTGQTRLTTNSATDKDPKWSPNGQKIAFHSDEPGNYEIYVMNADGSGRIRLTQNPAEDYSPSWSPNGSMIAFASNRDGNFEIYVMNADGTGQTRLTTNTGYDGDVAWSPDGKKIAFMSDRDTGKTGQYQIYTMNAVPNAIPVRITSNSAIDKWPEWSPDGSRIVFASNRDGNDEIYVMNADGTGQKRLTNAAGDDKHGVFSPDGRMITFTSTRDGDNEIYIMNADGSGIQAPSPAWFSGDWGYRKNITINHAYVSGTQAGFPVLVNITSDADLRDRAQIDGDDILFTSSDGTTKIPHEIEVYNPANGDLVAWVKVPSINAVTDTDIMMYYGNPAATSQQDAANVWDTGFKGVWHLREDPSAAGAGGIRDSTSKGHHGTDQGGMTSAQQVTGRIGGSLKFNNNAYYVDFGDVADFDFGTSSYATSFWLKGQGTSQPFVTKSNYNGPYTGVYFYKSGSYNQWVYYTGSYVLYGKDGTDGLWHHVVIVREGTGASQLKAYLDGSLVATGTDARAMANDRSFMIHRWHDTASSNSDAVIDEVRVSGVARSSDWIRTEYNNQNSPSTFITARSQVEASGSPTQLTFNTAMDAFPDWWAQAGFIRVTSTPAGASITLDGTDTGRTTGYTFDGITPGTHTVRVSLAGYQDAEQTVTVAAGETANADFVLVPTTGFIGVTSTPAGAGITLDGTDTGKTTGYTFDGITPGTHTVRVSLAGYHDAEQTVTVAAGETATADLALVPVQVPPAAAADGRIVFHSNRDGAGFEIYAMNADGTGLTRLTTNSATDKDPDWSTDGQKIAFHSDEPGNYEIYVMKADGTGRVRLTQNPAEDYSPSWSPDGSRIAFESNRDGNFEIYVMDEDGSGQTRLTTNTGYDGLVAWSPDGEKIAFVSDRDTGRTGQYQIYTMNVVPNAIPVRLTSNSAIDQWPEWSPDGTQIVFGSNRDGNYEIYVMNADGTGQARLTNVAGEDRFPAFSPDGENITFASTRDGDQEIILNAGGSGTPGPAWFSGDWGYRKTITINHAYVSGTQTSFPVLVNITSDTNLRDHAQIDGDDILFTSSDGTTKIPHEIEFYRPENGDLVAWVKVPSINAVTDTDIMMYYGNPAATSQQDAANVWDTGFKGIWHLNNAFTDSTSNGNNGANTGSTDAPGRIARGRSFDGNDYITIAGKLGQPSTVTLSAWASLIARDTGGGEVISIGDSAVIRMDGDEPSKTCGLYYNGTTWCRIPTYNGVNYAGTGWHYFTFVINPNGRSEILYVDGVTQKSASFPGPLNYNLGTNTLIGKHGNGGASFDFNGAIDEVRVSGVARSSDWIRTEYNNQNSPSTFITVGSQVESSGTQTQLTYEIYVMKADGTGQTRLTDNPAMDAFPEWGAVPNSVPEFPTVAVPVAILGAIAITVLHVKRK